MTRMTPGQALFERALTVHRLDCALLAERPADVGDAERDEPAGLASARSEEAVAYAVEARRVYDLLRRLVGQAAGLLILAEASGRRDVAALPEVAIARERWREAADAVAALRAPSRLSRHHARLSSATAEIEAALADLVAIGSIGAPAAAASSARLKAAYALLQQASDERYGLAMVDFRQACCTCTPPSGLRTS